MTVAGMTARHAVIAAEFDELIDVLLRDLLRPAELIGHEVDLREKLDRLHLVIRADEISSQRQGTVILEQDSIVVLDVRGDGLRHLICGWRAIRRDGMEPSDTTVSIIS